MNKSALRNIGLSGCAQDRVDPCESSIPTGTIFYNSKFLKKVSFVRKDKQTNRQTDRQTYGQTDRQTDRQTNRQTNILNHVVKTNRSAKPLKRLPHGNYIRIC